MGATPFPNHERNRREVFMSQQLLTKTGSVQTYGYNTASTKLTVPLLCGVGSSNYLYSRLYMHATLPVLPPMAIVKKATLKVYQVTSNLEHSNVAMGLYQVKGTLAEGSVPPQHESELLDYARMNENSNFYIIPKRAEAIKYGINLLNKNDILVLFGKGHENYEINKKGRIYFSERDIINDILSEK